MQYSEAEANTPVPLDANGFSRHAVLPYGLHIDHIEAAMMDFLSFLGYINRQLSANSIQRLESMLMPANFSSIVGEFMASTLPKYCPTLSKNRYPNGHPDLIPTGMFSGDEIQHATEGIEIKASRYERGWQGHNPEDVWLMVFVFDGNRPKDSHPKPFRFIRVVGAQLVKDDWIFSGRSGMSRRTITASVTKSGYGKLMDNEIYDASGIPDIH